MKNSDNPFLLINKPKVSIGLPVYNGETYIRETLDSLRSQTFKDFELIISDNDSIDSTELICREYEELDPRIRYVKRNKNYGGINNFKFVLSEALGEYFIWSASDDLQYPEFLASLVDVLDNNPNIVCVMSDVENVLGKSDKINYVSKLEDIRIKDVNLSWNKLRKRFFRNPTSNIYFCMYGLFRTNTIKNVDLQYKNIHKYGFSIEVPILAQVALKGTIASIPVPLKLYRRHSNSWYHKEQSILGEREKISGFLSVSKSLLNIIYCSNLSIFSKFNLFLTVSITTMNWLMLLPVKKVKFNLTKYFRTINKMIKNKVNMSMIFNILHFFLICKFLYY